RYSHLEPRARLFGEADSGRHGSLRHRDDHIQGELVLSSQYSAEIFPHLIDRFAEQDAVMAGEINEFKNIHFWFFLCHFDALYSVLIDNYHFPGLNFSDKFCIESI